MLFVDGTGRGGGFETSRCGASISGQADGIGGVSRGVPGVVALLLPLAASSSHKAFASLSEPLLALLLNVLH